MRMQQSHITYLAGPGTSADQATLMAQQQGLNPPMLLTRRGTALGWIAAGHAAPAIDAHEAATAWADAGAYVLPGFVRAQLDSQQGHIEASLRLFERVAAGAEVAELFEQPPYSERTAAQFEMLAACQDEGDDQEIETIEYDAVAGDEVVAENLWCKASWLSFEEDDASLRFRFSFGMVGYEDVAADPVRQDYAARLTEALFPESAVISANPALEAFMGRVLGTTQLAYVERIIYFNAPNGGAQFHQDVERGHLGVVFAQLHGRTAWLACAKTQLMDEIQAFINQPRHQAVLDRLLPDDAVRRQLNDTANHREQLNRWLDERDHEALELLLNRCPEFCRQLMDKGYGYILHPGDIILLPQQDLDACAWHTVFCLDDFPGESLSFAVRSTA